MNIVTPIGAQGSKLLIDPVTVEVVRMRLENIVTEMSISMMRSSGSPVITEAGDFNTALFDAEGRNLAYSDFVQLHFGSGSVAIKALIETVGVENIKPGDAYISNDPHTAGSTHPPDIAVITPIFDGSDRLLGFAHSQAHFMDVGGMTAGGFAPSAPDCYAEAVRLPPGVKIMDQGEVVESVKRILVNNVRLPVVLWNDVRSLIASNNVGVRRVLDTVRELGAETFGAVVGHNFAVTEALMRSRIAKLPDGTYEAEEWQEHNGHSDDLFPIRCRLIVAGENITLDFTGSAPQTVGFVNCAYGATLGSIASALMPILAWDAPVNSAILAPVEVVAPKGSIVNPVPPAPVSNGHLEVGSRVVRLVTLLLNKACERSGDAEIRARAQGIWGDSWTGGITAGNDNNGSFYVFFNMDGGGMGSGAQSTCDGLDGAGLMTQVGNILPDVEMNELFYPVLYLWKKIDPRTGGAGRWRGGMGLDFAWTLHGAQEATETVFAPCARVPAAGYGGGYPGGGSSQRFHRQVDIQTYLRSGSMRGASGAEPEQDLLELTAVAAPLTSGDVFQQTIAGGGGHGDPLLRPISLVASDLRNGYISAEAAMNLYGVVHENGVVDEQASQIRRMEIRAQRIGKAPAPLLDPAEILPAGITAIAHYVAKDEHGTFCRVCHGRLDEGEEWREGTVNRSGDLSSRLNEFGVDVRAARSDRPIDLIERFCPTCATSLEVEVQVA